MEKEHLFAYGTLVTGTGHRPTERVLQSSAVPIGRAFTYGELFDLGAYPGLVAERWGMRRVFGTVYRLVRPARALAALDVYEGHRERTSQSNEFRRRRMAVYLLPQGKPISSWVYVYNGSLRHRLRIAGGDYQLYCSRHRRA
jgi:gamma-glutamylcyclotransferase (GGCT)/AIG2-like uncharacterized protein YtfP